VTFADGISQQVECTVGGSAAKATGVEDTTMGGMKP